MSSKEANREQPYTPTHQYRLSWTHVSVRGCQEIYLGTPCEGAMENISFSLASYIDVSTNLAAESEGYIADIIGDAPISISFS